MKKILYLSIIAAMGMATCFDTTSGMFRRGRRNAQRVINPQLANLLYIPEDIRNKADSEVQKTVNQWFKLNETMDEFEGSLVHQKLTAEDMKLITEACRLLPKLKTLTLSYNDMDDATVKILTDAFQNRGTELCGNNITSLYFTNN
ncbi:MAG: hypothetical protein K6C34_05845, partial [Alphaproteobacteria bacterium]|nr:hypothetical protein [Alphaproteobacteria bacterium]